MLLTLKNITKKFFLKKGMWGGALNVIKAVDNVSLSMLQKENLSLVGESGSGKTTLARIIIKLIRPDEGTILFEGKDITNPPSHELGAARKNIQMVFQDPLNSLDPRFTIRRIMLESMHLERKKFHCKEEERMLELLSAVQLKQPDILERFPHEFSGGERQRIAIARALMLNPKLLILDEAVSSLDVLVQNEIIGLLKELQEKFNLTYLFITHNLRIVKKISQQIAVMYRGKIIESAKTDEILNNPLHPYTKELLSAAIEYKAVKKDEEEGVSLDGKLVDYGHGHYVLT